MLSIVKTFCFVFKDHYDFGMRAVKSVISAAGNLKRQYQDMNEVFMILFSSSNVF